MNVKMLGCDQGFFAAFVSNVWQHSQVFYGRAQKVRTVSETFMNGSAMGLCKRLLPRRRNGSHRGMPMTASGSIRSFVIGTPTTALEPLGPKRETRIDGAAYPVTAVGLATFLALGLSRTLFKATHGI